jgi:hypothetical protein
MRIQIRPITINGNGTSLWGDSKGKFTIDRIEVGYINWVAYPKDTKSNFHTSISLFGEETRWFQYTDRRIEIAVNRHKTLFKAIRQQIQEKLTEAKIARPLPEKLQLSWSEQGLQPAHGWNFDLNSSRIS